MEVEGLGGVLVIGNVVLYFVKDEKKKKLMKLMRGGEGEREGREGAWMLVLVLVLVVLVLVMLLWILVVLVMLVTMMMMMLLLGVESLVLFGGSTVVVVGDVVGVVVVVVGDVDVGACGVVVVVVSCDVFLVVAANDVVALVANVATVVLLVVAFVFAEVEVEDIVQRSFVVDVADVGVGGIFVAYEAGVAVFEVDAVVVLVLVLDVGAVEHTANRSLPHPRQNCSHFQQKNLVLSQRDQIFFGISVKLRLLSEWKKREKEKAEKRQWEGVGSENWKER